MRGFHDMSRQLVFALFAIITVQLPTAAYAVMSDSQIASKLEKTFDVKVLRAIRSARLGPGIVAVKVMNTSPRSNSAFQVFTIFVDENTGEPVPLYGEFISRLPRTSPLIWQRTTPVTVDDKDQPNME